MKCSTCRGARKATSGYKTCERCRSKVARYTELNRTEINEQKRIMRKIGKWAGK